MKRPESREGEVTCLSHLGEGLEREMGGEIFIDFLESVENI